MHKLLFIISLHSRQELDCIYLQTKWIFCNLIILELMSRLLNSHPLTGSEKISLGSQKAQVKGCDLIQKISITIRRSKKLNASLPRGDR